jgi:omega-6 fatty acid desaturase (delta-12 desaturase)
MQLLLENTYLIVFTIVFGAAICFSIVSFIMGTQNAIRAPVGFNCDWKETAQCIRLRNFRDMPRNACYGQIHARPIEQDGVTPHATSHAEAHLLYQPRAACPPVPSKARNWAQILGRYRKPSHARSIIEIAITFGPLSALWALAWTALCLGYCWVGLLLAIPAAGLLVRLFMIQHDCGHGSFFTIRSANDWVGRAIGVLTLTPYDYWRRAHAMHHASSGHLERRGLGDVDTLTVREYIALSFWGCVRYRLYRDPIVMFGMLVHLPIVLLAGPVGVWLFYMQHQFETTFWAHNGEWTFQEAALHGSSHYELPGVCQYRRAPCPPPRERDSLLPPAAGTARLSRASRREPADVS